MSKALPVFRPHTTSAPLATYHFCIRSIVPVLRLKFEAFRLSLLAFVSQVPVSNSEKILAGSYFHYSLTCSMAARRARKPRALSLP